MIRIVLTFLIFYCFDFDLCLSLFSRSVGRQGSVVNVDGVGRRRRRGRSASGIALKGGRRKVASKGGKEGEVIIVGIRRGHGSKVDQNHTPTSQTNNQLRRAIQAKSRD